MAPTEPGDDRPSLEMPSLGFGRKRKQPAEPSEPEPTLPERPEPPTEVLEPEPEPEPPPEPEPAAPRERRQVSLPQIGGMPAALLTGAVVGLLLVGLTWASLRFCELVRGTSTCGNPGVFLLLAVLVVLVLVGSALLRGFGVRDAGSTSFLGVGLVAVVVLLLLADLLFEWWMALTIPAVSICAFALSHWVTTAFVEPSGSEMHR